MMGETARWPVDGRAIDAQQQTGMDSRRDGPGLMRVAMAVVLLTLGLGCSRLRPKASESYVYVDAKQTFLRDRVAAVSNRTGTVSNGDRLEVLEHGRRFLRVKTDKGVTGWIDEKAVVPQSVYDAFDAMKRQFAFQVPVASAVVRDEVYLHVKPGRETDKLFRLGEGDKLKLLRRATLEKALPPGQKAAAPVPVVRRSKKGKGKEDTAAEATVDPNPVTGAVVAPRTITKTYRLEGNITRRLLPPNTVPPDEFHPYPVPEKKSKGRR